MTELRVGALVPLEDVSPGLILKSGVSNDDHTVVAVTETRIFMQVGGPYVYKPTKVRDPATGGSKTVSAIDPATSGCLREFGLASYQRKGFQLKGYADTSELKVLIGYYLKETCGLTQKEIDEAAIKALPVKEVTTPETEDAPEVDTETGEEDQGEDVRDVVDTPETEEPKEE